MNIQYSIFNNSPRSGQSMLLMVLILSGALLSVAMITGLVMLFQIRQAGDFTNSAEAIYAAETGAEWWRYDIRKQSGTGLPISYSTINAILEASNDSSFEVFPVAGNPNQAKIVGTSGNSKRALLITIQTPKGLLACDKEQQIDLVMIVDRPLDQDDVNSTQTAIRAFISKIMDEPPASSNVHIGITYVSNSFNVNSLTGYRSLVDGYISNLATFNGSFALGSSITSAINQLEDPLLDRLDVDYPDVILVIADSVPSGGLIEATTAKSKDIKIYVVNIGGNNSIDMEAISSGVGYYLESGSFSDLETTLVDDLLGCSANI